MEQLAVYNSNVDKWGRRFLDLAKLVASWSKDPSTKCGAVIVRPDKTICSTGFNGFPKGCSDQSYNDRDLKYARIIHAEMNAILHTAESLKHYMMFTYQEPMIGHSCDRCSAHIIEAGISTVITYAVETPERWRASINRGLDMYKEAGVEVVFIHG